MEYHLLQRYHSNVCFDKRSNERQMRQSRRAIPTGILACSFRRQGGDGSIQPGTNRFPGLPNISYDHYSILLDGSIDGRKPEDLPSPCILCRHPMEEEQNQDDAHIHNDAIGDRTWQTRSSNLPLRPSSRYQCELMGITNTPRRSSRALLAI